MLVLLPSIRNKWILDFSFSSDPLKELSSTRAFPGERETKLAYAP
jgi:hypothetical protein